MTLPPASSPQAIEQSWQRCRHLALESVDAEPLAFAQLRERRARAEQLLACALPELDALAEHATGNGCVVVLSDASGLILEEIGSPEFLPRAERVALTPGVDWSEGLRGTNAIGTALAAHEPVLVLGPEHYLPQNAALGCAAAPIFTGSGGIAGVLDISGDVQRVNRHALGIVRMSAQQIEHRLMLADARGHLLRFHTRPAMIGSSREALIVVDEGRIAAANRVALALLGRDWHELLGQPVEALLGKHWDVSARGGEIALRLPAGADLAMRIERLAPVMSRPASAPPATTPSSQAKAAADVLQPMLSAAVKVLNHGVPVLVAGETGCGKEVFARRLHRASRRSGGPFVAVNCAALPETLIEAELFGYDEGAFTGARRRGSPGRVREADGGVLFLDEIADMPLALQTRLLRVLEDRKVAPLGGGPLVAVDFDLVCATHGDLEALARELAFRSDLLYRVAGYTVVLPALRDRADRGALIGRLFEEAGGAAKQLRLEREALERLALYRWPGNVRELCSVLRAIVALAEVGDRIGIEQLALSLRAGSNETPAQTGYSDKPQDTEPAVEALGPSPSAAERAASTLIDVERDAIERALAACGRSVAEAARRLGVHRSTVYRYLAKERAAGRITRV